MAENLTTASNGPPIIDPSAFATMKGELRLAIVAKDSAVAKLRSIRKRMEDAGCDMRALDLQMKLEKQDDDAREIMLRNVSRYATWSGKPLGAQGALFGTDDAAGPAEKARDELREAEAYEAGYRAAQGGQKLDDCPHPTGTGTMQRWCQGWQAGRNVMDEVAAGRPPKETKEGARRPGRRAARQERASA
jgi:ribosome modulation factor